MHSVALQSWTTARAAALDEFEEIHRSIGRAGRGTKPARQQINQAFVLMLSGQFQGFCRDLHSESVECLVRWLQPASAVSLLRAEFLFSRKLDIGNPNAGNIGSDFNRLGLDLWKALHQHNASMQMHREALATMNEWRNAIAHQSFDPVRLGGSSVLLHSQVKSWRKSCDQLSDAFDVLMARHLQSITGTLPW